ncbi:MAG: 2-oxoacid:acceptor oxidoreductase family protein [Caldilineales bacterium]|nr:2-oxoacid:acceptor oxidoreductase family protein [Caldilineales bacterium]
MEYSVIFSGFGGQGALFAGQLLTYAAVDANLHVTWIPSYGPEMRGGTAHCTVVLGDVPIGSPIVRNPDAVVSMNLPSTDKYEPLVKSGGTLIANSSLVHRTIQRPEIHAILLPANTMAEKLGDVRMANVVMLGALLATTGWLEVDVVERALRDHLPRRHHHLMDANIAALHTGAEFARNEITTDRIAA